MQPARGDTVLGDFHDARFSWQGVTTRFERRDGAFRVWTDGPDGRLAGFPVRYTIGVDPLQQVLLELPGGRLQCLGIAWDARPRSQGGRRWFHLYPDQRMDSRNPLHWTRPQQNWNHMCAECHSTDLHENYRPAADRFETAFAEVGVTCEACHGPGSRHLAWARSVDGDPSRADGRKGLVFELHGASLATWSRGPDQATATRRGPASRVEVETCGRCHARRGQAWAEYHHGEPLAQTHRVALLDEGLYEADGQIRDEVFEYGSFLQSRMFRAGVTCTDCHEPHGGELRAEGNALCTRCHFPARFDTPAHHHHPPASAAARCVSCHMPEHLYMVIDGRRDHSLRVPRPDLSVKLGTPNACNGCHRDESARWAAAKALAWWGPGTPSKPHWGEAIDAGRRWLPGAARSSPGSPPMVACRGSPVRRR